MVKHKQHYEIDLVDLNDDITNIGNELTKLDHEILRLFHRRKQLLKFRDELEDDALSACEGEDADFIEAELERPYEDDGGAHG